MAVESVTKISDLNELWPLGTDPRSEGDDHIRNIKKALKASDGGAVTNIVVSVKTTSGTYAKPAGLKLLEVTCVGGGGGSHTCNTTAAGQSSATSGAGGGGVATKIFKAAELSASTSYTVGAGGAANAGAGGSSVMQGVTGGGGGIGSGPTGAGSTWTSSNPGNGGAASGGTQNYPGGDGQQGVRNADGTAGLATAGGGGGNMFAMPTISYTANVTRAATQGSFPGGGAAGSACGVSQSGQAGAVGGAGCVILKEYF